MTAVDTVIVTATMTTVVDHHTSQVDMVMVRGDEVRHPHRDFSQTLMSSGMIIETMAIGVDHHREVRGVTMINESSNEKNTIVQNLLLHRATKWVTPRHHTVKWTG
jgi:hypothetical protein